MSEDVRHETIGSPGPEGYKGIGDDEFYYVVLHFVLLLDSH